MGKSWKNKILMLLAVLAVGWSVSLTAHAQGFGLEYGTLTGLGTADLRVGVMQIIRVILGFLGIIAILIVLYGGFVWMTAGGNEEKVTQAKAILRNGVIGLVIILLSFAIASFIINALIRATGAGGGGLTPPTPPPPPGNQCTVTSISPKNSSTISSFPINSVVRVVLSAGDIVNFSDQVVVTKKNLDGTLGPIVEGTSEVIGNRLVQFKPTFDCLPPAPPGKNYKCFEPNTTFVITVGTGLTCGGNSLTCGGTSCTAEFTTGNYLDIAAPSVSLIDRQICQGPVNSLQAQVDDDHGIPYVRFTDEGDPNPTHSIGWDFNVSVPPAEIASTNWDTSNYQVNAPVLVKAEVVDYDSNQQFDRRTYTIRAGHCCNARRDGDEVAVDCGGNGCEPCVPTVEWVWNEDGAPGNLVTIHGRHFGPYVPGTSQVWFSGPSPVTPPDPNVPAGLASSVNSLCTDAWSNTEIIVAVPPTTGATPAGDGPLKVTGRTPTGGVASDITAPNPTENRGANVNFFINSTIRPGLCDVNPPGGLPSTAITLQGKNYLFGQTSVHFGATLAGGSPVVVNSASGDRIDGTSVPDLNNGTIRISAKVNQKFSNPFSFAVGPYSAAPLFECTADLNRNSCVDDPANDGQCNQGFICSSTCTCVPDTTIGVGVNCDGNAAPACQVNQSICDGFETPLMCDPSSCTCQLRSSLLPDQTTYTYAFQTGAIPGVCSSDPGVCSPDSTRCAQNQACDPTTCNCVTLPAPACTTSDRALVFNGTDSQVLIPSQPELNQQQFTYEIWVKPETLAASKTVLARQAAGGDLLRLAITNTSATATLQTSQGLRLANGAASLTAGAWHHLAVTYDRATLKFYVDGGQVGASQPLSATVDYLQAGSLGVGQAGGEFLPGSVDDLALYRRALTASEVFYHYQNLPVATGDLIARWEMNEADDNRTVNAKNAAGADLDALDGTVSGGVGRELGHNDCTVTQPGIVCDLNPATPICEPDNNKCASYNPQFVCDPATCTCQFKKAELPDQTTYTWNFSTATLGPTVVENCNRTSSCGQFSYSSPFPFDRQGTQTAGYRVSYVRRDDGPVPVDAIIGAMFTKKMYLSSIADQINPTIHSNITVRMCGERHLPFREADCSPPQNIVDGIVMVLDANYQNFEEADASAFYFWPVKDLFKATSWQAVWENLQNISTFASDRWYLVELKGGPAGIMDAFGFSLTGNTFVGGQSYKWVWSTRDSAELSIVQCLQVQPAAALLTRYDQRQRFIALPRPADFACIYTSSISCSLGFGWSTVNPGTQQPDDTRAQIVPTNDHPFGFVCSRSGISCDSTKPCPAGETCTVPDPADIGSNDQLASAAAHGDTTQDNPPYTQVDAVCFQSLHPPVHGQSNLAVDFSRPYVIDKFPDCGTACLNAKIGVTFSRTMDDSSVDGAIKLYICFDDESCVLDPGQGSIAQTVLFSQNPTADPAEANTYTGNVPCYDITGDGRNDYCLVPDTYYRVVISGATRAQAGVDSSGNPVLGKTLGGLNFDDPFLTPSWSGYFGGSDSYSWVFKTQKNYGLCVPGSILVRPDPYFAPATPPSIFIDYSGQARAKPDQCDPLFGQRLNPYSFDWSWDSTQPAVADLLTDAADGPDADTAGTLNSEGGNLRDACGNGVVEVGEDCDDGNLVSGDGCTGLNTPPSIFCPNFYSASRCSVSVNILCGPLNPCPAGESCGLENCTILEPWCQVVGVGPTRGCDIRPCVREGARQNVATCGNGIIERGEECERDAAGNFPAFCGHSPEQPCVWTGNRNYDDGTGKPLQVCGNGILEPNEECEPPSAAGCGPTCLYTGTGISVCGNGRVDFGEECDEGELLSGSVARNGDDNNDGIDCSSVCLVRNNRTTVSFCQSNLTNRVAFEAGACAGSSTPVDCQTLGSQYTCRPLNLITGNSNTGQPVCGNALVEQGEECDLGGVCSGPVKTPCTTQNYLSVCGAGEFCEPTQMRYRCTNTGNLLVYCDPRQTNAETPCIDNTGNRDTTRCQQLFDSGCSGQCLNSGSVYESVDPANVGAYQIAMTRSDGETFIQASIPPISGQSHLVVGGGPAGPFHVIDKWPNCGSACVNAALGGQFSQSADPATIIDTDPANPATDHIFLYECGADANCLLTGRTPIDVSVGVNTITTTNPDDTFRIYLPPCYNPVDDDQDSSTPDINALLPNTYYRVVVRGDVQTPAPVVRLTGLNFDDPGFDPCPGGACPPDWRGYIAGAPDSYSWTFKTAADATLCAIDRIQVIPEQLALPDGGIKQRYFSQPWTAPDQCSAQGQRLNAYHYNWRWLAQGTTPIPTPPPPAPPPVPPFYNGADIVLPLKDGCGNGVLEPGEDCDPGLQSVPGCNLPSEPLACRWKGTNAPLCGNGRFEAGEECEDSLNGTQCSTTGRTCSPGPALADRATCPGGICRDLCGSTCLWQGTASYSAAVCGNGIVERAGVCVGTGLSCDPSIIPSTCLNQGACRDDSEECDSGSEPNDNDADGCTNHCRFTGSVPGVNALCGDGQIGPGEECDDGDLARGQTPSSGDGCTGVYVNFSNNNDPPISPSTCSDVGHPGCEDAIHRSWCYWTGRSCVVRPCLLEPVGTPESRYPVQVCQANASTTPRLAYDFSDANNCPTNYSEIELAAQLPGNTRWRLPVCGNGRVEVGEECDDGGWCVTAGSTTADFTLVYDPQTGRPIHCTTQTANHCRVSDATKGAFCQAFGGFCSRGGDPCYLGRACASVGKCLATGGVCQTDNTCSLSGAACPTVGAPCGQCSADRQACPNIGEDCTATAGQCISEGCGGACINNSSVAHDNRVDPYQILQTVRFGALPPLLSVNEEIRAWRYLNPTPVGVGDLTVTAVSRIDLQVIGHQPPLDPDPADPICRNAAVRITLSRTIDTKTLGGICRGSWVCAANPEIDCTTFHGSGNNNPCLNNGDCVAQTCLAASDCRTEHDVCQFSNIGLCLGGQCPTPGGATAQPTDPVDLARNFIRGVSYRVVQGECQQNDPGTTSDNACAFPADLVDAESRQVGACSTDAECRGSVVVVMALAGICSDNNALCTKSDTSACGAGATCVDPGFLAAAKPYEWFVRSGPSGLQADTGLDIGALRQLQCGAPNQPKASTPFAAPACEWNFTTDTDFCTCTQVGVRTDYSSGGTQTTSDYFTCAGNSCGASTDVILDDDTRPAKLCDGGNRDRLVCAGDSDCPGGTCSLAGVCTISNAGSACITDDDCGGAGACVPLLGNQHVYEAICYDTQHPSQVRIPISQATLRYDWSTSDPDDLIYLTDYEVNRDLAGPNSLTFVTPGKGRDEDNGGTPAGKNGTAYVISTASQFHCETSLQFCVPDTNNRVPPTPGTCPGGAGNCVPLAEAAGNVEVTNFICDNPWPDAGIFPNHFPYLDNESESPRVSRDMNFRLFYCRDAGKTGFADDLPPLAQRPAIALARGANLIKDLIFAQADHCKSSGVICNAATEDAATSPTSNDCADAVAGPPAVPADTCVKASTDAIGIEARKNPLHLSPSTWYRTGLCGGVAQFDNICTSDAECLGIPALGHWTFDEGAGTTVNDSSGNNNTSTLADASGAGSAPSWDPQGRFGGALRFTRDEYDRLEILNGGSLTVTRPVSVSVWINLSNTPTSTPFIILDGPQYRLRVVDVSGQTKLQFAIQTVSREVTINSDAQLFPNRWYHLVGVFNGEKLRTYVDGVVQPESSAVSEPIVTTVGNLAIGARVEFTPGDNFDGKIDEPQVYALPLTAAQVTRLFASSGSGVCQFNVPLRGGPQTSLIDGYEAVVDGRTVYVSAANLEEPELFTHMYLISYNQDAGKAVQEIFSRILDTNQAKGAWQFNDNFSNYRTCINAGVFGGTTTYCGPAADSDVNLGSSDLCAHSTQSDCDGDAAHGCYWDTAIKACQARVCVPIYCRSDLDCPQLGYFCDNDGNRVYTSGDVFYPLGDPDSCLTQPDVCFGHACLPRTVSCSAEKLKVVRDTARFADLRDTQLDLEKYFTTKKTNPLLGGGTFVASTTFSVWPSWQITLGKDLGQTLAIDPINTFIGCTGDAAAQATCWNNQTLQFSCPADGLAFAYRAAEGGKDYELYANLEYEGIGSWRTRMGQGYCDVNKNGRLDPAEADLSKTCITNTDCTAKNVAWGACLGPYHLPLASVTAVTRYCDLNNSGEIDEDEALPQWACTPETVCSNGSCLPLSCSFLDFEIHSTNLTGGLVPSTCTLDNDTDGNGDGDNDDDGICDGIDTTAPLDNCIDVYNPDQRNSDGEGDGDACDEDCSSDQDGDGICDEADNCRTVVNCFGVTDGRHCGDCSTADGKYCPVGGSGQFDRDLDGVGDLCDPCTDVDLDGRWDIDTGVNACARDNAPAYRSGDGTLKPFGWCENAAEDRNGQRCKTEVPVGQPNGCTDSNFSTCYLPFAATGGISRDHFGFCTDVSGNPLANKTCCLVGGEYSPGACDTRPSCGEVTCGGPSVNHDFGTFNPFQEDFDNDGIGYITDDCVDFDGDGYGDYTFFTKTFAPDSAAGLNPAQLEHLAGCSAPRKDLVSWNTIPSTSCGNGSIDFNEQCDDGPARDTNGDGINDAGNGVVCTPPAGDSCEYCTIFCTSAEESYGQHINLAFAFDASAQSASYLNTFCTIDLREIQSALNAYFGVDNITYSTWTFGPNAPRLPGPCGGSAIFKGNLGGQLLQDWAGALASAPSPTKLNPQNFDKSFVVVVTDSKSSQVAANICHWDRLGPVGGYCDANGNLTQDTGELAMDCNRLVGLYAEPCATGITCQTLATAVACSAIQNPGKIDSAQVENALRNPADGFVYGKSMKPILLMMGKWYKGAGSSPIDCGPTEEGLGRCFVDQVFSKLVCNDPALGVNDAENSCAGHSSGDVCGTGKCVRRGAAIEYSPSKSDLLEAILRFSAE